VEPRLEKGHVLPTPELSAAPQTRSPSVSPPSPVIPAIPVATATSTTQTHSWMLLFIAVSVGSLLLALMPDGVKTRGSFGSSLVKARLAFATLGMGLLAGVAVPLLMDTLK
jgi:hypothetical protein